MVTRITDEQRQALDQNPGSVVLVEDEQTKKVYLLIPQEQVPSLWEEHIEREVSRGLKCVDAGEVVVWDPDRVKAEGRRRLKND